MSIPLYNCYWCKCAWCAYGWSCKDKECYKCRMLDKKGKLPSLRENCEKFLEKTPHNNELVSRIHDCNNCKFKRILDMMLEYLGKSPI